MKQNLLKTWLVMLCMLVGIGSAWGEEATMAAGTNGSAATVNEKSAIKVGTSKAGGDMTITVPVGATSLEFYAAAWNGVTELSLNITPVANVNPTSVSLTADTGISGNSPFTLSGTESSYKFTIALNNITKETTLTLTSSAAKRFVVWGATYTTGGGTTQESTKYTVTVANNIANGTVTASSTSAAEGAEVTLTAIPNTGYELGSWDVKDASNNAITVTNNIFTMPAANVNVSATFNQIQQGGDEPSGETASFIFNTDTGLSALGIAKPNSGAGTNLGTSGYTSSDITMNASDGGTATRVWNSNGTTSLRVYKDGGSLTFSGATITKVVFTGTVPMTANVGTFSDKIWTGEASSVIFTATNSVTISTIEVTYASDSKTTPILSFAEETYNATRGENFTAPILTNTDNVTVTYTSSKTDVATVDETTGEVTLVAPGTTKITASFAGDDTYKAASASYELVVAPAKYTVTIETPMNGTLTIKDGEITINSGDKVAEGTTLTIVVEAADGYKFKNWGYKDGDANWVGNNTVNFTHIMPSAPCSFKATFVEIPTYTIAWSVNGAIVKSEELKEGTTVTAPATPEDINGKTFTGWVETSTVDADATPTYVTPYATAEKEVTYYAVFATTDGQEASVYTRVTELSQLTGKKHIVIIHNSDNMVLTHENSTLSGTNQTTAGLNETDNQISIPNDKYIWSIEGDNENGWVLSESSSSIGVNTLPNTDKTGNNADISFTSSNNVWAFGMHNNTSNCFYMQNLGETEGTIKIAASFYSNKFNVFTTSNIATSYSSAFKLYVPNSSITFSDFTTTPLSVTLNSYGYATFSYADEIEISGATAYTGLVDEEAKTITWTEIKDNIIPANEGVLLKGEAGASVSLSASAISKAKYEGNDLKPNLTQKTKAELGDFIYVLSGESILRLSDTGSLKANKAYFQLTKYITEANGSNAKFTMIWNDDSEATGINSVNVNTSNNAVYNLAGQRVNANAKGIVIMNGKKYLNK